MTASGRIPKIGLLSSALVLCSAMVWSQPAPVVKGKGNNSFNTGEELRYKATFGFFTVGRAVTRVDQSIHPMNGKPCYKIDAFGSTSDWVSWLAKVDDNWGAYLDTATVSTQVSYRRLREGRYRKDEMTYFNHNSRSAEVRVREKTGSTYKVTKTFPIPPNATDLIGGFIHLRFIDFSRLKPGDSISIAGFLEDTAYNLRILYKGKTVLSTRLGKIPCYELIPRMPDNKLFDGENSITVWVSEDQNRIPVRISARMFIGSTGIELDGYNKLRHPLRLAK